jgi:hypothetical protein
MADLTARLWKILEGFGRWVSEGIAKLGKFFWNLIEGWVSDLRTGATRVLDEIKSIPDKIKNLFMGAGEWVKNSGKALWQGFIDGMNSMIPNIRNVVGDIMNRVGRFFMNSPAKEGRFVRSKYVDKSGKILFEDFAGGMEDGLPTVIRATDKMMNAIKFPTYGSAVGNRTGAIAAAPTAAAIVQHYEVNEAVSARATAIEIQRLSKVGI